MQHALLRNFCTQLWRCIRHDSGVFNFNGMSLVFDSYLVFVRVYIYEKYKRDNFHDKVRKSADIESL